jgi:hypothetical protein
MTETQNIVVDKSTLDSAKEKRKERNRLFYLKKKAAAAMFDTSTTPAVKKIARKIGPKNVDKFREDAVLIQSELTALIAKIVALSDAVHSAYNPSEQSTEPAPAPEPEPEPEPAPEPKKSKKNKTEKPNKK